MAAYLSFLNTIVSVLLAAACWWLYRDGKGRRMAAAAAKLEDGVTWETSMLARVVDHDLRIGVLERVFPGAPVPPPVPPPVSFMPAPGGLPLKPVTLTKDDDPDHTRATVEAPPPPPKDGPPTTKPTRSSPRVVPFDKQAERAAERHWMRRADQIREDATLVSAGQGEGPSSEEAEEVIRARFHAEADAKDARDALRARETTLPVPPLGVEGEADEDEHRDTWEDATRMLDRSKLPPLVPLLSASGRPPPHAPPRPLGGRPTLLGGLAGAGRGEAPSKNRKGPPATPEVARGGDRETLTPTDPGSPLDARIRRRWAELCAEAQGKGKTVGHCHAGRCMATGEGIDRCDCDCDACDLALTLLVKAEQDIRAED